ncbi:hypothetical protein BKP42_68060 [Rhodococcus erythropolis]|nr:hypothetical protein BKP42_68060 [Rhodococcus erythropolis]
MRGLSDTEARQTGVGRDNALRQSGRAGSVDHPGRMSSRQWTDTFLDIDWRSGHSGGHLLAERSVHDQPLDVVGEIRTFDVEGQAYLCTRVAEHVRDTICRIVRIDRNDRCPGLRHCPHREYRFDGSRNRHRHKIFSPETTIDQDAGQLRRPLVDLAIRHGPTGSGLRRAGVAQCDVVRVARSSVGKNLCQRRLRYS